MAEITLTNTWVYTYNEKAVLRILYCNHRKKVSWRRVIPVTQCQREYPPTDPVRLPNWEVVEFRTTEHHPEPQQLFHCICLEKKDYRSFALVDCLCIIAEAEAAKLSKPFLNYLENELVLLQRAAQEAYAICKEK
jgi:hypothetical protein